MAVPFGPKENEWAWELKIVFRNIPTAVLVKIGFKKKQINCQRGLSLMGLAKNENGSRKPKGPGGGKEREV